jgi:hypothetical protein
MHASRKILLKHFDARAEEYHAEIFSKNEFTRESNLEESETPVCFLFVWFPFNTSLNNP